MTRHVSGCTCDMSGPDHLAPSPMCNVHPAPVAPLSHEHDDGEEEEDDGVWPSLRERDDDFLYGGGV